MQHTVNYITFGSIPSKKNKCRIFYSIRVVIILTSLTRHLPIKFVSGDDLFRLCQCTAITNFRSPMWSNLYSDIKVILWQPSQLMWVIGDHLLHKLCLIACLYNIIKQGKLVVSCFLFFLLRWAGYWENNTVLCCIGVAYWNWTITKFAGLKWNIQTSFQMTSLHAQLFWYAIRAIGVSRYN